MLHRVGQLVTGKWQRRKEGRKGWRKEGREGERKEGRERKRERKREGGREEKKYSQSQEKKHYSVHLGSTKNAEVLKACLGHWFFLLSNLDQEY